MRVFRAVVGCVALMITGWLALASVGSAEPFADVTVPARIEAEHYDSGADGEAFLDTDAWAGRGGFRSENPVDTFIIDNSGASGALLGRTRDGEFTQYTVEVTAADEFDVRLSVASGHPLPGVIHVDVDGLRVGSVDGATNRWFDWTTRSAGTVALDPGSHVVQLTWDEGAQINLDWLELVSTAPQAAECPSGPLEAEAAVLSGRFEIGEDTDASGGAYAHVPRGSGGWWNGTSDSYVEFCASVETEGDYRIDAQLKAVSELKRSFYVSVDNGRLFEFVAQTETGVFEVDAVNHLRALDPLRSGNVDDGPSEIVDPVTWNLEPGDHTIRFYLRRDGAQLDTITFTPVDGPPSVTPEPTREPDPSVTPEPTPEPDPSVVRIERDGELVYTSSSGLDENRIWLGEFDAAAGEVLHLSISRSVGEWRLFAPNGRGLLIRDAVGTDRIELPQDGTYTLWFQASSNVGTGSVRVQIVDPVPLDLGVPIQIETEQYKFWRGQFIGNAGERVYLPVINTDYCTCAGLGTSVNVKLFGPNGQQIPLDYYSADLPAAGLYEVEIFREDYLSSSAGPTELFFPQIAPVARAIEGAEVMSVTHEPLEVWLGEFNADAGDFLLWGSWHRGTGRLIGPDGQTIRLPRDYENRPVRLWTSGTWTIERINGQDIRADQFRVLASDPVAIDFDVQVEIPRDSLDYGFDVWLGSFEAEANDTITMPGDFRGFGVRMFGPDGAAVELPTEINVYPSGDDADVTEEFYHRTPIRLSVAGEYIIQVRRSPYPGFDLTFADTAVFAVVRR